MLTHMAKALSSFFITVNLIKEEERIIYNYCFEILLSTIINMIAIVILALRSGTVMSTLCFIIGFMIVRTTAGGFHAETHIGCFLVLVGSYGIYLSILLMCSDYEHIIMSLIFCILSWILVAVLSPVEDHNKPFSEKEYLKFKIQSNLAVFITIGISIIETIVLKNVEYGFSFAAGMCVVSLSLIAGTIKNNFRKRRRLN